MPGFDTVSLDLIYARPGQRPDDWRRELETAAGLGVEHISCYQLTVHSGTGFARLRERGRLEEMPDEGQAELFHITHAELPRLGFEAYEVSNFARSREHRSAHNRKYWAGAPYLGLGPSAHSHVAPRRWWNVADVGEYLGRLEAGKSPVAETEVLSAAERLLEAVMLGMRNSAGLDLARLESLYGTELRAPNAHRLDDWSARGLVRIEGGRVVATPAGWLIADRLASELDLGNRPDRVIA